MKWAMLAYSLASELSRACSFTSASAAFAGFFQLRRRVSSWQVLLELSLRRRRCVGSESSRSLRNSMLSPYFSYITSMCFFSYYLVSLTLPISTQSSPSSRINRASLSSPISASMAATSAMLFCLGSSLLPSKMGLLLRRVALVGGSYISKLFSPFRMLSMSPPQKRAGPLGSSFALICWSSGDSTDSNTSSANVSFTGVRPKETEALSCVRLKLTSANAPKGLLGGAGGILGLRGGWASKELSWVMSRESCSRGDLIQWRICWQRCGCI